MILVLDEASTVKNQTIMIIIKCCFSKLAVNLDKHMGMITYTIYNDTHKIPLMPFPDTELRTNYSHKRA